MKQCLLLVSLLLSGCAAVGLNYERPDVGLRETDVFASAPNVAMPGEQDLRWWLRFNDPLLTRSVEAALAGNLDIALALERAEQARSVLRAAQARRVPALALGSSLGGEYRRGSNRSDAGRDENGLSSSAGLTVDWNADLWGGLRQAERSAAALLMRSQDLAQAARLATAGLAARGYITWLQSRHELALFQKALQVRQETVRLAQVRVDAGLAPLLDLTRAQADLNAVKAELDGVAGSLREAALALQVLSGVAPVAGAPGSAEVRGALPPLPALENPLSAPRPVDLLRLRPDVRAAEHALVSRFAEIGVAQAALYPQLTLPGELLWTASGLGTGSIVRALTAGLTALLQASVYDGGLRAAEVDAARSLAREAALLYRRTVLEALEQVETALIGDQVLQSQRAARQAAVRTSQIALDQANVLYREGLTGFLDILEAQRTLLANQLALVRTEADAVRASVALFEATGLITLPAASETKRLAADG